MLLGPERLDMLVATLRDMNSSAAFFSIMLVLLLCGLGLPVPEDIILVTAGIMAALGKFHLITAIVLGFFGVLSGDAMLFFLGRRYGDDVLRMRWVRYMVRDDLVESARRRVLANERFICFIARFLPGLRSPIYLMAGAMGVPPRVYFVQDGLAAALSVPLWVIAGWWFGTKIDEALAFVHRYEMFVLGVVVFVVLAWIGRAIFQHVRAARAS